MGITLGTLTFAVGLGVWLLISAARNRQAPMAALIALEAALVVFAGMHLATALSRHLFSPKLGAYLAVSVFLVPLFLTGTQGRSRTVAGAMACCAAVVLVLRVEAIA